MTDLAGRPRYRDDLATQDTGVGTAPIIDMGAFEFQPRLQRMVGPPSPGGTVVR